MSLRAGRVFSTFPVSGRSRRKKAVEKGNQVLVDVLLQVGLSKGRRHLYSDLECPRGSQAPFPPRLVFASATVITFAHPQCVKAG